MKVEVLAHSVLITKGNFMSIHAQSVVVIAASLLFSALPASAVTSRQAVIVASPAVTERTSRLDVAAGAQPSPTVIIITPAPLPAVPPNACQRGNSSGVSRC